MSNVATIGLDIAKSVFQVHGVDAAGQIAVRRKLTRGRVLAFFKSLPRCLVGIEACSSSHYWARELIALGHDVRLLPAQYVKPYLKRQKNDAADAEDSPDETIRKDRKQLEKMYTAPGALDRWLAHMRVAGLPE